MIAFLKKFVNSKIGTRDMIPLDELAKAGKIASCGSRGIVGSLPWNPSGGLEYAEINCPISISSNTIVTNITVAISYLAHLNQYDGMTSTSSRTIKTINASCIYDKSRNKFKVYLPRGVSDDRFRSRSGSSPLDFNYSLSFEYYTYTKFLNS